MAYSLGVATVGNDVRRLQEYLNRDLTASLLADGAYGGNTKMEVMRFRQRFGLPAAAVFDESCAAISRPRGYHFPDFDPDPAKKALSWPGRRVGLTSPPAELMQTKCGTIVFVHDPIPKNAEHIRITNNFVSENIIEVDIPQLRDCVVILDHGVAKSDGRIQFHRNHANRLAKLFADWEAAGLLDRILSFDGSFNARLKRGKKGNDLKNLSNHSWGTAIDLNASWNQRTHIPAQMADRGCIRELVAIGQDNGFYWGGHFTTMDGMHFEVAAERL